MQINPVSSGYHLINPLKLHLLASLAASTLVVASPAQAQQLPGADAVTRYPAVPMTIQRVANVERAHLLVESVSRPALQRFLAAWQPVLRATKEKGLIRWAVDVDPLGI